MIGRVESGTVPQMVKLVFLCWRRPDISHERYAQLLLEGHVPLALRHHPTLRRYVVNVVEQSPDGWEALDSIGELWFDSLADFQERLYDSPAGRAVIERDVAGFMGGAHAYVTTEHVQRAPSPAAERGARSPGVKLICPLLRADGLCRDAFVRHWLRQHVALALRHQPGMSGYVTNVVSARLAPDGPDLDGIAELHFPSAEVLRDGMFDSLDGERIMRADIVRFIGRTAAYRVAEYVQQ